MLLTAASDYPLPELARLWKEAYAAYFVPVSDDPEQLRRHVVLNDVDLARSLVGHDEEGRFVGLSLLGVRGKRAWIGGFGIATEFRRRGLSGALIAAQLESARSGGITSVQLEVLEQNWASKVYAAAGFVTRRRLHGLRGTLPARPPPLPMQAGDAEELLEAVARAHAPVRMGWQRELASLRHALARGARGFLAGDGKDGESTVILAAHAAQVLDAAGDPEVVIDLLAGLTVGEPFTLANEPEESPLAEALLARGFERVWTQLEMIAAL